MCEKQIYRATGDPEFNCTLVLYNVSEPNKRFSEVNAFASFENLPVTTYIKHVDNTDIDLGYVKVGKFKFHFKWDSLDVHRIEPTNIFKKFYWKLRKYDPLYENNRKRFYE